MKRGKGFLWCGMLSGPVFTLSWLVAGATRGNGYNPLRHPVSSLAIGPMGWTQSATFLVVGILLMLFSVGLTRILKAHGASPWGGYILALCALGLFGAGLFTCDPLSGYPGGLNTLRADRSWHGMLHDTFSAFLFIGFPFAAYKIWRAFSKLGQTGWAAYTLFSGALFVALFVFTSLGFGQTPGFVNDGGLLQRATLTVFWCWTTLLAFHFHRKLGG